MEEILQAAVEGTHLSIVYDSVSGLSERVIYPFGIFAYQGFWYCACHDYKRDKTVILRADRFRSIEPVEGFEQPPHVPLEDWVKDDRGRDDEMLKLRAYVSEWGMKNSELVTLLGRIETGRDGRGAIDTRIPSSGLDFYAGRLLGIGPDVIVESPPELIEAMSKKAEAVASLYSQDVSSEAKVSTKG